MVFAGADEKLRNSSKEINRREGGDGVRAGQPSPRKDDGTFSLISHFLRGAVSGGAVSGGENFFHFLTAGERFSLDVTKNRPGVLSASIKGDVCLFSSSIEPVEEVCDSESFPLSAAILTGKKNIFKNFFLMGFHTRRCLPAN